MRLVIGILVATLLAAAIGTALHADSGYALLSYRGWRVEMSLATLVILTGIIVILAGLLIRSLRRAWRLPRDMRRYYGQRRHQRARRTTMRGLIDLAEGRWQEAERRLTRSAARTDTPLINYLAAARAAQLQDEDERRDEHLRQAYEQTPAASVAVLLTQAELQLAHHQFEHALATLRRLQEINPGHAYGLRLLARLYRALEDWDHLRDLVPRLRKAGAMSGDKLDELEALACRELLHRAGNRDGAQGVEDLWREIPKRQRQRGDVALARARALHAAEAGEAAERAVREGLKHRWDPELVRLYGRVETAQLERAEYWLRSHPEDPDLLLTLGRLCVRNRLWGKARSYLERSLQFRPASETYEEYGRLLRDLGEPERAMDAFRKGLELSTRPSPHDAARALPQPANT